MAEWYVDWGLFLCWNTQLVKWDTCEKNLSWETSLSKKVKDLHRIYIQKYKNHYLIAGTFLYAEHQKNPPFSSVKTYIWKENMQSCSLWYADFIDKNN